MMSKEVYLILFAGQSNMAGRGITCDKWPQPAPTVKSGVAYEYRAISDPGKLHTLTEPFGKLENNKAGIYDVFGESELAKTGSLVSAFCEKLYEQCQIPIVGVSASKGGSSLLQWQPESPEGYLKDALSRFDSAKDYLLTHDYSIKEMFVLWTQGETDGDLGTLEEKYISLFSNMWSEMKKHIPKLYMIQTGQCNIPDSFDRYDYIQSAQEKICQIHSDVTMVSTAFKSMREMGLMKDSFHYYQHGYNLCGEDAAVHTASHIKMENNNEI